MRILITGSRDWTDVAAIERALLHATLGVPFNEVTVVSGHCPSGADAIAEQVAHDLGMQVEPHAADWERYKGAAGYIRNADMVQAGADVCLAFQLDGSKGTGHTIRLARAAGIHTHVDSRCTPPP